MKDKDILEMLGLTDQTFNLTLESDILNTMDTFLKEYEEHEEKKREFMSLFRECFQDIVNEFEKDPRKQIAVNCAGCRYSNRVELGYGKATKRTSNNGVK